MHLLRRIERHLRATGTPPTLFGRAAVRDPRFVLDMRNGREPRPPTVQRVSAYLDRIEGEVGTCRP